MFEELDAIPWSTLNHCYGSAGDAPKWIRALAGNDADLRSVAVYEFLLSSAFHQYTLYPVTPYVIPFVLEALGDPELCDKPVFADGEPRMKQELLCFLQACARVSRTGDDVGRALLRGRDVYAAHATDASAQTREYARRLSAFCRGDAAAG